jgi:N-acetylneuraminic acid mutarotase
VAQGPRLQGLALVAHDGKLYRIGGFTAKNPPGEDHDLWSQNDFASFDPATGQWTDLPSLPEPRSSHDAAVIGDIVYVVGGWSMQGPDNTTWHTTAWNCDLSAETKEWTPLPQPPFQRRALSLAAHNGKLYCLGGMQEEGGPTRAVAVYDPESKTWRDGPKLLGEKPINGFGSSSFAVRGKLYVSTLDGSLQKLSDDGQSWEKAGQLERARFFHRMLPLGDSQFVFVGGANMGIGKFEEVEVLDVE